MAIQVYTVNGKAMTVAEMAMAADCSAQAIYHRLSRGKTAEEAVRQGQTATLEKQIETPWGFNATYAECAKILGDVTTTTFRTRVNRWGVEDPRTWQSSTEISQQAAQARIESNRRRAGTPMKKSPEWVALGEDDPDREKAALRAIPGSTKLERMYL